MCGMTEMPTAATAISNGLDIAQQISVSTPASERNSAR